MSERKNVVEILNINHPGNSRMVDARPYTAMRDAILKVAPVATPGTTVADLHKQVIAHLPEDVFPGGAKSGWWLKAVQLDLEARGELIRGKCSPLRLSRRPGSA
jgi:hypothetical protein